MNKDRTGSSELNETPRVRYISMTSSCCATGTRDGQVSRRRRLENWKITTSKVPDSVKNFENTKA